MSGDAKIQNPAKGRTATSLAALEVFLQRRTLVMLALGFASGLPYLLIFDTLSAWLRESGLSLTVISSFFLVTLINPFKFVWSPVVDHLSVPWLGRRLGKRRAWMLVAQAGVVIGLIAISRADPAKHLGWLALFALWTTFFSSTQDIVIDAWRIEAAGTALQGAMAASYQWGYRLAMIVAGAAPLIIAQARGWPTSYAVMASLMIIGVIAVLLAPIPEVEARSPDRAGAPEPKGGALEHVRRAIVDPFADFFSRFGTAGFLILAFICFYRLSDFTLTVMNPYYLDLGFQKTQIAEVRKVFGAIMTTVGVFVGGYSVSRFGLMRPMLFGSAFVPLTHLVFAWLATRGPDIRALLVCIGVDNMGEGFAGTLLIAFMSSLTSAGFTATQYALFSSLYALPGKLIGANSGRVIESLARQAVQGGPLHGLTGLFTRLPATSFRLGALKLGVTPQDLAAGYFGFFIYACSLGLIGVVLAVVLARRRPGLMSAPSPGDLEPAPCVLAQAEPFGG